MAAFNILMEFEGPVVDLRPRYWAAHQQVLEGLGFSGPPEEEFWRLVRTGAADGAFVRFGKERHGVEYGEKRAALLDDSSLMALDELQPGAEQSLPALKKMGSQHLVTLCRNRDGINASLDRLNIWMHFDKKQVLPADRDRRVDALKELRGEYTNTLAIVGTVPMAHVAGEAGCRVIGIANGPTFPNRLRQAGVDAVYDDLDALTDALSTRDNQLQRLGLF